MNEVEKPEKEDIVIRLSFKKLITVISFGVTLVSGLVGGTYFSATSSSPFEQVSPDEISSIVDQAIRNTTNELSLEQRLEIVEQTQQMIRDDLSATRLALDSLGDANARGYGALERLLQLIVDRG